MILKRSYAEYPKRIAVAGFDQWKVIIGGKSGRSHLALIEETRSGEQIFLPRFGEAQKRDFKCLPCAGFLLCCASFMAKTAWLERNKRKQKTVEKYAALRAELKAKKDYASLTQLPRDASPTRLVNRCRVSGRRRAFLRRFQISRITFRELASSGLIPGVTKSSW
jgi:small subunit ribosomal protein S14